MDELGYDEVDGQSLADSIVLETARMRASEARRFLEVARFADVHGPGRPAGADGAGGVPGAERPRRFGADGTPEVLEFTSRELSPLIGSTPVAGSNLLRDALDVRHRHPLLWDRIRVTARCDAPGADPALAAGLVEVWQAREVARQCHAAGLTRDQARWVDTEVAPVIGRLAWSTVLGLLAERVIAADPEAAEARRNDAARTAYVAAGQCNEHGMKTLVAKAEAGDVIAVLAILDLLADCLKADGHDGTRDVLRARALGVLANPAEVLALLLRHALVEQPAPADQPTPADEPGADDGDQLSVEDALDLFADRRVDPREGGPVPGTEAPTGSTGQAGSEAVEDTEPPPNPERPGRWMAHLGGRETLERLADLLTRKIDPTRLTPRRVLYLHLAQNSYRRDGNGVARFEGEQPVTLDQLGDLFIGARVTLKPVIDLENQRAVERYAVPADLTEAVQLASSRSLFPWSPTSSRAESTDMEHATAFDPDLAGHGEPQTCLANLGPLDRGSHRVKTHQPGWTMRQPRPGTRYWCTRYGYCYRVDGTGTHPLGRHTLEAFHAGVDADQAAHANGHWLDAPAVMSLMREVGARPFAA